jgi:2-polyprenyl-6-methoxyphenol hydroxylase-like FAD-dependent oxidoreductase
MTGQPGHDADVVICGAGPVGLFLATEVALAGATVVVVDAAPGPPGQSRAMSLQPRTAEVLQLRGLFDRLRAEEVGRMESGHFAGIPLDYAGLTTRFPYQPGILQASIERMLAGRLRELGGELRRGWSVTGLTRTADQVTVHGPTDLTGAFLVGCDGSRSIVRRTLGIPFPGTDATRWNTIADVELSAGTAQPPRRWTSLRQTRRVRADGHFASVVPIGGTGLYRFVYFDGRTERAEVGEAEIRATFTTFYGDEYVLEAVRHASRFSDATRQATRYREGRVFLAGDAAHIHPPAGGQGLNLGLQDAFNLGWKLGAVLHGRPGALLDTYEAERHPAGAAVIGNTLAQGLLQQRDTRHLALRSIVADLLATPAGNQLIAGLVSGIGLSYPGDPPVGRRLPDVPTSRGPAYDLFADGRSVLLTTTDTGGMPVEDPGVTTATVDTLPWPGVDAVIVRPDGYVCWASNGGELRRDLERPDRWPACGSPRAAML